MLWLTLLPPAVEELAHLVVAAVADPVAPAVEELAHIVVDAVAVPVAPA